MKPYRFEQLVIGANVYRRSDNVLIGRVVPMNFGGWKAIPLTGDVMLTAYRSEAAEWLMQWAKLILRP